MSLDFWMTVLGKVFQLAAALFLYYSTLTKKPVSSDVEADILNKNNNLSVVHLPHFVLGAERWLWKGGVYKAEIFLEGMGRMFSRLKETKTSNWF